jgi:DNA polymerase
VAGSRRALAAVQAVEREWQGCTRCRLYQTRSRLVHWRGTPGAPLMLVGEAPGAEEDRQGRPFVGPTGQRLDRLIAEAGVDPAQVFVANAVACRPPQDRTPNPDEIAACRPRLNALWHACNPTVTIPIGQAAEQAIGLGGLPDTRDGFVSGLREAFTTACDPNLNRV